MPRNGVGTYVLPAGQPVVPATTISSTVFNLFTNDVATALTNSLAVDGQTPMAASLPMGNNKITGLAAGVSSDDAARMDQVTGKVNIADLANTSDTSKGAAMVGGLIANSVTLNVPAQYATVQLAMAYLADKTIARSATVTIQVADGVITLASGWNMNHPQGRNIRLIGNQATPTNVEVRGPNPPTFDALTVTGGNSLGFVDGFYFNLLAKATQANNYTAVLADNSSFINCGSNMKANNWYYSFAARNGSVMYCDNVISDNAGDVGIWAFVGSEIRCRGATATNTSDSANGLGFGFQAEYGSSMDCSSATASGCYIAGIAALSNSTVRALGATSSTNTGSGFLAQDGGTIENHNATANNNTRYALERITDGMIRGNSFTASGNVIGFQNSYAYIDNSGALGARIAANGDFRIDVNGTNNFYFNTSGGVQLNIGHTAGSVNYPKVTGSATTTVTYSAEGTGTNLDVSLQGKGTGFVFLGNNRQNYLRVNAQNSGTAPQLRAEGVDTDIDLFLGGKGAGLVRFGVRTAGGDTASNGYITMKDAAGNTVKLMTTA